MGRNPFGIEIKQSEEKNFRQALFYFIKEFKINPFDEEYELYDKNGKFNRKLIKKGISIPLFNILMEEMNEHYKRENAEMKKASRRR